MRSRRYSTISALMVVVVCAGFCLAALRNADPYWASGAYNLACYSVALAVLGAFLRKGNVRALAAGYAIFSLAYLVFAMLPGREVNIFDFGPQPRQRLLLEQGFALLQPYVKPIPAGSNDGYVYYDQVAQSVGMILSGVVGAVLGRIIAGEADGRSAAS